ALIADLRDGEGNDGAGEAELWEGFWSDDQYFVRRTRPAGDVQWFRLVDETSDRQPARPSGATRVLNFPTAARLQTRVVIAQSPDGRRMLVGSASRSSTRVARRSAE